MPDVPNVPNVPIAGGPPPDDPRNARLTDQQWEQHRLRQRLEQELQDRANQPYRRIYYKTIRKGALISFHYRNWKHDPYPLELVSSIYTAPPRPGLVAGINLHYLTFRYIRYMIRTYCGQQFSYSQISNNLYIYNAFRTYKRNHMVQVRLLDCDYLAAVLGAVRSFRPSELEAIRRFVQEQLRRQMNPTADDIAEEYESMVHNDPRHRVYGRYMQPGQRLPREYGQPYWWVPKPTRGDYRRTPPRDTGAFRNPNSPGINPP